MLTIPSIHGDIPFVLTSNQLKIHDTIQYYDKLLLRIPRQYGLTYYISYLAFIYPMVSITIVSPNLMMRNEISCIIKRFMDQLTDHTNYSMHTNIITAHNIECSGANQLYKSGIIIYPEFDHIHLNTEHKDYINELCIKKKNTKVILCSQGNIKWKPANINEFKLK